MTNRDAINYFRQPLSASSMVSDDSYWNSDRLILETLIQARAVIIKTEENETDINDDFVQVICMELELHKDECTDSCAVLRTKNQLPSYYKIISVSEGVGDNMITYNKTTYSKFKNTKYSRSNSGKVSEKYYVKNQYLEIVNRDPQLEKVTVEAVFYDPIEAAVAAGDPEATCCPYELPFYSDKVSLDSIVRLAWDSSINLFGVSTSDILNDQSSNERTPPQPKS